MNILITGGAGFIGSNLALYFQENFPQYSIVIFDAFNNGVKLHNGNYHYLGHFKNLKEFRGKIICGDLNDIKALDLLYKFKFDLIFHLAAISDTRAEDQQLVFKTNVNSFYNIIDLSKSLGARLVYASSAAVYGNMNKKTLSIGDENPNNPYAFSKLVMDNITFSEINSKNKSNIVGLRYFNVYGNGEQFKGLTSSTILQFALQIKNNKGPILFENSENICRDFVYIKDVIQATAKAGFSDACGIYNVGTGKARSFKDIADTVQLYLGTNFEYTYIKNPYTEGYQNFTQANISETESKIGYKSEFDIDLGISDYIKIINTTMNFG